MCTLGKLSKLIRLPLLIFGILSENFLVLFLLSRDPFFYSLKQQNLKLLFLLSQLVTGTVFFWFKVSSIIYCFHHKMVSIFFSGWVMLSIFGRKTSDLTEQYSSMNDWLSQTEILIYEKLWPLYLNGYFKLTILYKHD